MKREYLDAIERQRKWLAFSKSREGQKMWSDLPKTGYWADSQTGEMVERARDNAAEQALYERALTSKNVFYVGEEFCRLIDSARATLPDDVNFENTWVPTDDGWLWCETPIVLPKMAMDPVKAATKGRVDSGTERHARIWLAGFGWVQTEAGTAFCAFQTGAEDATTGERIYTETTRFFPITYFSLSEGQNLRSRVEVFERNTERSKNYISYEPDEMWRHEVRWIFTALLMFDQRILATRRERVTPHNKGQRRRMEREGNLIDQTINVVTLRRFLEQGAEGEARPNGEPWYSIRFEVSGHWRQQYYPSKQTHKPIWILPYEKGPEDAPFKAKNKRVFAAVR